MESVLRSGRFGANLGRSYQPKVDNLELRRTTALSWYTACKSNQPNQTLWPTPEFVVCSSRGKKGESYQPVLFMTSSVKMILGVTYFSEGGDQQGQRFKIWRLYHVDPDVHLGVRIFYVVSGGQSFLWWDRRGPAKFWQDFSTKFIAKLEYQNFCRQYRVIKPEVSCYEEDVSTKLNKVFSAVPLPARKVHLLQQKFYFTTEKRLLSKHLFRKLNISLSLLNRRS